MLDLLCGYIVLLKLYNCLTCPSKQSLNLNLMRNGNEKQEMVFMTDEEGIEISSFLSSTSKSKNFVTSLVKDPR